MYLGIEKGTFGDMESEIVLNLVLLCKGIAIEENGLFVKRDEWRM